MDELSRAIGDGLTLEIIEPPRYQRWIARIERVVLAPLSWLNILDGSPPSSAATPPLRVVVRNASGKTRTVAIADDLDTARIDLDAASTRIASIGYPKWAREHGFPPAFDLPDDRS